MYINQVADMMDKIIRTEGIETYLPTLIIPAKREVYVLEGIPKATSHQNAARKWATEKISKADNYFLSYRSTALEITIEEYNAGKKIEERKIKYSNKLPNNNINADRE